ncbi:MAG: metallophosphoesterase family protein [Chloroflexi bacterium]|nr:metallophosphoesterase family protein [Chloroflexota bacterium]
MRIAVISDVHANLGALNAIIEAAGPVDGWWHLGDVVGYGPDPDLVVERLAGLGAIGCLGNHDAAALGGPEIDWFNPDARRAMEWTRSAISPRTRAWLGALKPTIVDGERTLVHGSPRDPIWEYVTSIPVARANLAVMPTRLGLHGHTHLPMAWLEDDGVIEVVSPSAGSVLELRGRRALVNPGSVGQPRDGDVRAAFMILDTDADLVTWHRVSYDVAPVQAAMRDAGLPAGLVARLAVGY